MNKKKIYTKIKIEFFYNHKKDVICSSNTNIVEKGQEWNSEWNNINSD